MTFFWNLSKQMGDKNMGRLQNFTYNDEFKRYLNIQMKMQIIDYENSLAKEGVVNETFYNVKECD